MSPPKNFFRKRRRCAAAFFARRFVSAALTLAAYARRLFAKSASCASRATFADFVSRGARLVTVRVVFLEGARRPGRCGFAVVFRVLFVVVARRGRGGRTGFLRFNAGVTDRFFADAEGRGRDAFFLAIAARDFGLVLPRFFFAGTGGRYQFADAAAGSAGASE